jgi:DNA invertase Pin-like site-specific DNA recombinase
MSTKKPTKPVPVAVFVRVSTDKQNNERQIHELREAAAANGWDVVEVIEEAGISGNAGDSQRHGLARARELANAGQIRKVLFHEVSRLARRNSIAHGFLEEMETLGVSLYWHAQRIETLLPSGKRNPAAAVMFALLAEMARSERETLVERINSGLAKARRDGRKLGRPKGSGLAPVDFLANHKDVEKQLGAGQSIRNAAKITGKGVSTVQRVKAAMDARGAN